MFKTQLLLSAARIDELGQYRSPNVCFIDDEDDNGPDDVEEVADEGGEADDPDENDEGEDGAEEGDDRQDDETRAAQETDRAEGAREEQPRRRGASDVIRESKKRAKEAEERLVAADRAREAAERRAEDAERRANERRQVETEAQERERLAVMTEDERVAHYRQKDRAESDEKFRRLEYQTWNSSDRVEFRELCREDPLMARVKDKVEAKFEELRAKGQNVQREIIANQEIALMFRAQRKAQGTKQRTRGAETVRRETTRPARARSDAPSTRTRRGQEDTKEARFERIKDVSL